MAIEAPGRWASPGSDLAPEVEVGAGRQRVHRQHLPQRPGRRRTRPGRSRWPPSPRGIGVTGHKLAAGASTPSGRRAEPRRRPASSSMNTSGGPVVASNTSAPPGRRPKSPRRPAARNLVSGRSGGPDRPADQASLTRQTSEVVDPHGGRGPRRGADDPRAHITGRCPAPRPRMRGLAHPSRPQLAHRHRDLERPRPRGPAGPPRPAQPMALRRPAEGRIHRNVADPAPSGPRAFDVGQVHAGVGADEPVAGLGMTRASTTARWPCASLASTGTRRPSALDTTFWVTTTTSPSCSPTPPAVVAAAMAPARSSPGRTSPMPSTPRISRRAISRQ